MKQRANQGGVPAMGRDRAARERFCVPELVAELLSDEEWEAALRWSRITRYSSMTGSETWRYQGGVIE